MILERLVLHNFGVFRGRHEIDIAPKADKPIVLIGGLNGAGKTSILDALQLALYGKLSQCSNRGELPYDQYLLRCINRAVPPTEGAGVEIEFSHTIAGEQRHYRVKRSWLLAGTNVRERVQVLREDRVDELLTDAWDEHVDAFIPSRLAPLFFFDSEKIEALAQPASSRAVLETALNALLGLDVVRRLEVDLSTLERRHRTASLTGGDASEFDELRTQLDEAENQRQRLFQECAAARNEVVQSRLALDKVEGRYQTAGGDSYERRGKLEVERDASRQEVARADEALRQSAIGAGPLLLVRGLLDEVCAQAQLESRAELESRLISQLEARDEKVLATIAERGFDPLVREAMDQLLRDDRMSRAPRAPAMRYLEFAEPDRLALDTLLRGTLPDLAPAIDRQLELHERAVVQADLADMRLAAIPDKDDILSLIEERATARARVDSAVAGLAKAEGDYQVTQKRADTVAQNLDRLLEVRAQVVLGSEDSQRLVHHSSKARDTLVQFRSRLLEHHAGHIQQLILESFVNIARKQDLLSGVRIDATTCELTLLGKDGAILLPERLSAGERQLLAVSILWGLARAAGRPLPAVIDTPLGRLDSTHRVRLAKDYFPRASHQVILLSTDEEIDESLFLVLKPRIARSYVLRYDPQSSSTRAEPGYFWS